MHVEERLTVTMCLAKKERCGPGPCGEQPGSHLSSALGWPWGGKELINALPENWSCAGTLGMGSNVFMQRGSLQARGTREENPMQGKRWGLDHYL